MQVLRYNNLHPGELSPASLKQYEKRVRAMVGYYTSWKADPTNFKPPAREPSDKADKTKAKPAAKKPGDGGGVQGATNGLNTLNDAKVNGNGGAGSGVGAGNGNPALSLLLPFPLRDNYLAQVTIPRDMTKDEADRLCAFIQALARA